MMGLHRYRWIWIIAGLFVLGSLAACGSTSALLEEQAEATIAALPTTMVLPTLTPAPDVNTTPDPLLAGLPSNLTGFELIAARIGTATYTGYNCSYIAEPGCVCDEAVIQRVTFTFETGDRMHYSFGGSGYAAEWPMARLAPNQWGYTFRQGIDEASAVEAGAPGDYSYMLQFTEIGYALTQGANVGTTFVSCPTITFQRLMSSTAAPTPGP
jgi:hypothetical protein